MSHTSGYRTLEYVQLHLFIYIVSTADCNGLNISDFPCLNKLDMRQDFFFLGVRDVQGLVVAMFRAKLAASRRFTCATIRQEGSNWAYQYDPGRQSVGVVAPPPVG